jgi:hypothetical protein
VYTLVAQALIPEGWWAIQANAHIYYGRCQTIECDDQADCQLRTTAATETVIGAGVDSRVYKGDGHAMIPMNGGIAIPPGYTGSAYVWCRGSTSGDNADAQIMAIKVGGFF